MQDALKIQIFSDEKMHIRVFCLQYVNGVYKDYFKPKQFKQLLYIGLMEVNCGLYTNTTVVYEIADSPLVLIILIQQTYFWFAISTRKYYSGL